MTTMEREAIAAICLMASMADGTPSDAEQQRLRDALGQLGGVDPAVFQRVIMRTTTIEDESRRINDPELKRRCYELAVGVCDSDGTSSPAEREFLAKLVAALGVPSEDARQTVKTTDEMVDLTLDNSNVAQAAGVGAVGAVGAAGAAVGSGLADGAMAASQNDAAAKQADDSILTYAALNAGLELLPQSLATVAVVPLQVKMVHKIGTLYGYKLDSGSIKEFIATVGAGLSGQFVESYARKFLSTLAGKYLGKTAGKIVEKTTGPVMTFATTYALGQVAKSYYAGGRTLSMSDLQRTFASKVEEAKGIYARKEPEIRAQASKLDPANIMSVLRG
jgi:uncharacterized protein (DUF697 family)/tellurite resistance protein